MSLAYIRQYYQVDAKRGVRVAWDYPHPHRRYGTIVGAQQQYIRVRFDGERGIVTLHPTWKVEYNPTDDPALGGVA